MTATYHFKLGTFDCIAIHDNARRVPISQEIAGAPPAELSAAMRVLGYSSDEAQLGYNCLLVRTGEQRVLVDTGSGRGQLVPNLQAAGLGPADIDIIILTHGDGDHIGGIVDEHGQLTFPKARYVIWHEAWAMWTRPDRRAYLVEQFLAVMRRRGVPEAELAGMAGGRAAYGSQTLPLIQDRVDLVELETEFLPGFQLIAAPGHRTDHVNVAITSAGKRLLHVVDSIRHPVQMPHPEWCGTIDSFPQEAAETRRRLLQRAAADQALIFGAHLTFPGLGYVQPQGPAWGWQALA